jgi:murein DD-endopeptidase MepM/ murein hydrolase activator NlpD
MGKSVHTLQLRGLIRRVSGWLPGAIGRGYTVLILPHARPRFRKLHLSRGFVLSIAILSGVLVLAGLALPHLILRMQTQSLRMDWLEYENQSLRREKEAFETALGEVSERLEIFEVRADRLAKELNVSASPAAQPAVHVSELEAGRGGGVAPFDDEIRSLSLRTGQLDASLTRLDSAFQRRVQMLAATPSMMPVEGWFSHTYGWRNDPFTGERDFHSGVDIVAPTGTRVVAPADGVVSRVGTLSAYGKSIDLAHSQGYVTRYGHLSAMLVKPGQRLKRGDVIGRVGSTGRSTGPHLHYEVYRNGRTVNPWKYLGKKGS